MPKIHVPKLRSNSRGYAYVEIKGKRHYLGCQVDDPQAQIEYRKLLARHRLGNFRREHPGSERPTTLQDLIEAWRVEVERKHVRNGRPTSERSKAAMVRRALEFMFDTKRMEAANFKVRDLVELRDVMVQGLLPDKSGQHRRMCRQTINELVSHVVRMFNHGVGRGLVEDEQVRALKVCIEPLKGGEGSETYDPEDVEPVEWSDVEAVLGELNSEIVRSMILTQWFTGMRSCEVVAMRPCDVDRSGRFWTYTVPEHARKGSRVWVLILPDAQSVMARCLMATSENERVFAEFNQESYRRSIHRACDRIAPEPPEHLRRKEIPGKRSRRVKGTDESEPVMRNETHREWRKRLEAQRWRTEGHVIFTQWDEYLEWQSSHRWNPHQLRHAFATRMRKLVGKEVTRILLGHRHGDTTDTYSRPADLEYAVQSLEAMRATG